MSNDDLIAKLKNTAQRCTYSYVNRVCLEAAEALAAQDGSLRDTFAAQALLIAHEHEPTGHEWAERMSARAYAIADAMLQARAQ